MAKKKIESKIKKPSLPPKETEVAKVGAPQSVPVAKVDISAAHASDAEAMRISLENQPKVSFMVPLEPGEADGAFVPVTLNGYRTQVPKGKIVQIPQQIAEILTESLNLTSEAGKKFLINRAKPGIQEALE